MKIKFRWVFLILLITTFLAYGLTLDMYFWKDDFALMIKAMHPEESVGFFGPGFKGDGAYRYVTTPFALLYPIFKLNPAPYFLVGTLLYFIASLSVYFLALTIFEDKRRAFLTALIFSSGFIGADSIFGLTNSYQTSWTIALLCLVLTLLVKHFKSGNWLLYLLSVILFYWTLELGYIRAHGFFIIILSTIFLVLRKINLKEIIFFVMKMIPFFFIFRNFYLLNVVATNSSKKFLEIISSTDIVFFVNPFITFVNVFFPNILVEQGVLLISRLTKSTYNIENIYILMGLLFIVANIFLILWTRKKIKNYLKNTHIRVILFSLMAIVGSFIGVFYIGAGTTYLNSTHRYLATTLLPLSFYWMALFSEVSILKRDSKILTFSIIVISITFIILGNVYALDQIRGRTNPQKNFFGQLKNYLPEIYDKTFLHFDVSNLNNSQGKFGNIFGAGSVGGSPEISLHYNVDRYSIVTSINSFDDFLNKFQKEKGKLSNTYALYYDNENLVNHTEEFRRILENGETIPLSLQDIGLSGDEFRVSSKLNQKQTFESPNLSINFPKTTISLTPMILGFDLKIKPLLISWENFVETKNPPELIYFEYLLARKRYYTTVRVSTFDHFQDFVAGNLIDQKPETTWMAARGSWHNIINKVTDQIQFIEITLDSRMNIGGILFTNGHQLRTPTAYQIMVSKGDGWEASKKAYVENKNSNEKWFEKIDPVLTDKVRVEILNSASGDAPQLSEVELIDAKFSSLDFDLADKVEFNPTVFIRSKASYELIKEYFSQNGKISFAFYSDKDNDFVNPPINVSVKGLENIYSYEVKIPANGQRLIMGKLYNLNLPAEYSFSNFKLHYPSLADLLNQ